MTIVKSPQQLLLIKYLYEDGRSLTGHEDDLSLTKSVIILDLAVEQMLNTIIMDLTSFNAPKGKPGRKDIGWGDLWGRASSALQTKGNELINHSQLLSLHEVRNLAVHNASIPSQVEVQRYIEPIEEMLIGAFRDGYSLDFQKFRLWDLVANHGLRQLLINSDHAHEKGHFTVCIVGCVQAHNLIIAATREVTRSRRFRLSGALTRNSNSYQQYPPGVPFEVRSKLEQAARQVEGELGRRENRLRNDIKGVMNEVSFLENELVTIGIGMPLMETRRFQMIGEKSLVRVNSRSILDLDREINGDLEGIAEEARFMLSYMARLIRLIDQSYPEIVKKINVQVPLTTQDLWKAVEPPETGELAGLNSFAPDA